MNKIIRWFVDNPIAANMLMVIIVVSGAIGLKNVSNEFFPSISPKIVTVTVAYPGAGPAEVEEQICIRIEQAISDVEGIKAIRSTAQDSLGIVTVEASANWPVERLLSDVKTRVDAISTLPVDAERPLVTDPSFKPRTDNIILYGNVSEAELKIIGNEVTQEITRLPGVSSVSTYGERATEFSIEVAPQTLLTYGLRLEDITAAIRSYSLNVPAGEIKQSNSYIQIQIYGQAYTAESFGNIPIISKTDGAQLLLKDLATIYQGFEDTPESLKFNGQAVLSLQVFAEAPPDFIGVSKRLEEYIETKQAQLPDNVTIKVLTSNTAFLKDRLDLLAKNALQGLVLVFIILMLFLSPYLAGWVVIGLATAYLGAFTLMSAYDISLSMISSFAFLLILGIVVDDAIIIGESIYAESEKGTPPLQAAKEGTLLVAKPVLFAVSTTMAVFLPGALIQSTTGQFLVNLSLVAIFALMLSLVESLCILPSHLSHMKNTRSPARNVLTRSIEKARLFTSGKLDYFTHHKYAKWLSWCLKNTYTTFAIFTAAICICLSLLIGGWQKFNFFPDVPGDILVLSIEVKDGLSTEGLNNIGELIRQRTENLKADPLMRGHDNQQVVTDLGVRLFPGNAQAWLYLIPDADREIESTEILTLWESYLGEFDHTESFNISANILAESNQKNLALVLTGSNGKNMQAATEMVKASLSSLPGVYAISDSDKSGGLEVNLQLKPHTDSLGIDLSGLARQVRYAFYGQEAQKIPSIQEEIKVMVRYPEQETTQLNTLENMWVRTGDTETPLSQLADIEFGKASTEIKRLNGSRIIEIGANIRDDKTDINQVIQQLMDNHWPAIQKQYPGLSLTLGSQHQESDLAASQLASGLLLVILFVYALFAIEFRSYVQPLMILSIIPFGMAGSIIGHMLFGYTFSMPSLMGLLATAGVVINDNLVLIDKINRNRETMDDLLGAIQDAAKNRLRPIFLTTATTFFGLTPILFETSTQAEFLKPMATSLSFGVLFSSPVTLILVPVFYLGVEKLREKHRQRKERIATELAENV